MSRTGSSVLALGAALFLSLAVDPASGIELVAVGDPANPPDFNGRGAVPYIYEIGKFEVLLPSYAEYLNAVDPAATSGDFIESPPLGITLTNQLPVGARWTVRPGYEQIPVRGRDWCEAARFVNWLELGKPSGPGAYYAANKASYDLTGCVTPTTADPQRIPEARWALPSVDEWHKAAYYEPADPGSSADLGDAGNLPPSPNYWLYPTRSDFAPQVALCSSTTGEVLNPGPNTANYDNGCRDLPGDDRFEGMAQAGGADSPSPWGTFDQAGNLPEMLDQGLASGTVTTRGGSWGWGSEQLRSSDPLGSTVPNSLGGGGFRVILLNTRGTAPARLSILSRNQVVRSVVPNLVRFDSPDHFPAQGSAVASGTSRSETEYDISSAGIVFSVDHIKDAALGAASISIAELDFAVYSDEEYTLEGSYSGPDPLGSFSSFVVSLISESGATLFSQVHDTLGTPSPIFVVGVGGSTSGSTTGDLHPGIVYTLSLRFEMQNLSSNTAGPGVASGQLTLHLGPRPDLDGDGVPDNEDNCAETPNSGQSNADEDEYGDACDLCPDWPSTGADFDANGIGDECECGDQTMDGVVNVTDLLAINDVIFGAVSASPLCDANNDGLCNVADILGANAKIFGAEAHCERYPAP